MYICYGQIRSGRVCIISLPIFLTLEHPVPIPIRPIENKYDTALQLADEIERFVAMLDEAYHEPADQLLNVANTSLRQLENVRREIGIHILLRGAPMLNPPL